MTISSLGVSFLIIFQLISSKLALFMYIKYIVSIRCNYRLLNTTKLLNQTYTTSYSVHDAINSKKYKTNASEFSSISS